MTKKKLFRIVFSTVILIAAIDFGVNRCMHWYMSHFVIPGDYKKIEYMFKNIDAQILLLGASTCMNSINPEVLEKELGKSAFNGGANDQRLEFFDVMSEAIFKSSPPELLILVLRQNDLSISGRGRLALMNIYYHRGNRKLDDYLDEGRLKQKILLRSALYKFNTYWWRILLYHFKSFDELAHGGFVGKPVPKIVPQYEDTAVPDETIPPVNPRKLQCLENIVSLCRETNTRLWIVIPPEYHSSHSEEKKSGGMKLIQEFCTEHNIPFFDDTRHPDFLDHPEYFYDVNHLNVNGAELYTRHILDLLRKDGL